MNNFDANKVVTTIQALSPFAQEMFVHYLAMASAVSNAERTLDGMTPAERHEFNIWATWLNTLNDHIR